MTSATAIALAQERRAAAACGAGSMLQAASPVSFWRAMSDQSALWLLAWLPSERER